MSPLFQLLLFTGSLVFLMLVVYMVKKSLLGVRFSLPWLVLGGSMLVLSVWTYPAKVLRALLQIEVVSNMIFLFMIGFILLILLALCSAASKQSEQLKRLTQANAILEERVRKLEQQLHR